MARVKQVSYGDHKTARKIYHEAQSESTAYFSASESEDVSDSLEVEVAHVQKHNGKGLVAGKSFESNRKIIYSVAAHSLMLDRGFSDQGT